MRQRGDSNPCGQSPMDFESISLAARTHCHLAVSSKSIVEVSRADLASLAEASYFRERREGRGETRPKRRQAQDKTGRGQKGKTHTIQRGAQGRRQEGPATSSGVGRSRGWRMVRKPSSFACWPEEGIPAASDLLGIECKEETTARGFEPLRAEPNGFRVHLLNRSDTLS